MFKPISFAIVQFNVIRKQSINKGLMIGNDYWGKTKANYEDHCINKEVFICYVGALI